MNYKVTGFFLLLLSTVAAQAQSSEWAESYRLESLYQFGPALDAVQSVINKSSTNEFAHLRAGWLQYQQGNYSKAVAAYTKALELNAKSIDARLGLSLPLMAQQRWREAKLYVEQVLAEAPWHYTAHARLMAIEEAQKQWTVLSKHASELHRRYPSDPSALVYLARSEDRSGNKKAAAQAYNKVLEIIPDHVEALWYTNTQAR